MYFPSKLVLFGFISELMLINTGWAADKKKSPDPTRETIAKSPTAKEKAQQQRKLREELVGPFRKWLKEDVLYIISDEEKIAFSRLDTDEEREQFIEQFWIRRDPSPDTVENEYKEEHYRRIAYANERYASGIPGWKTDRGRIYITFGPPDENDPHPSGGTYERPTEEGGGTTSTYPFEKWRYRWIEGVGTDIVIEFIDPTMTGEYRMTMDPSEKDALINVPGADRITRTDGTSIGPSAKLNQFERLQQIVNLRKPPKVKFTDLEALVNSTVKFNVLPVKVRVDFLKMTTASIQTNITLQLDRKDLQFQNKETIARASVNIYARITSLSRRVVNVFEDVVQVEVPIEMLERASAGVSVYQKSVPLPPGSYRLNVVVQDVYGGNRNNYEMALTVPRFDDDVLSASSVILTDQTDNVGIRSVGTGQFVIGSRKVRPRVSQTFHPGEKMSVYFKLYNLQPDSVTNRPVGSIEFEVVNSATNATVYQASEDLATFSNSSEITIERLVPIHSFEPGQYTLRMNVTDKLRNQTLRPQATFTIAAESGGPSLRNLP